MRPVLGANGAGVSAAHHKLDHPNIVSLLDSGTDQGLGVYYVVLS
ncbi:hypothetical protein [Micromonospora chersina]